MTIKILTICDYGQVRSVGMKCYLNGLQRCGKNRIDKLEYDVIAVGSVTSSKQTMKMLKKWADIVIDVRNWIPEDIYGNCWNDELQKECEKIWEEVCSYEKYKPIFSATKDNQSSQETQEKGESPISLVSELDNGEYAKKPLSKHNPANNTQPQNQKQKECLIKLRDYLERFVEFHKVSPIHLIDVGQLLSEVRAYESVKDNSEELGR